MARPCWSCGPEKASGPAGFAGLELIRRIQQDLLAEGIAVSIAKLCTWFGIPRRTVYYKPVKPRRRSIPALPNLSIRRSRRSRPSAIGPWSGSWASKRTRCGVLSDQGLAGSQARRWHAASHPGGSFCRSCAEREVVDRSRSYRDRQGRQGFTGPGDRLPHPRAVGLAPVEARQGHDGRRPRACADREVRYLGSCRRRAPGALGQ